MLYVRRMIIKRDTCVLSIKPDSLASPSHSVYLGFPPLVPSKMKLLVVVLLGLLQLVAAKELPASIEINADEIDPEGNVDVRSAGRRAARVPRNAGVTGGGRFVIPNV